MTVGRVCAVHQPNLFPRWRTLTKLLAADTWVVLDDVQFCRRDHQNRSLLRAGSTPRWLVAPVRLPHGRRTLIQDAVLVDRATTVKRIALLTRQYYGRRAGWPVVEEAVDSVAEAVRTSHSLRDVAELSTIGLLRVCGWNGRVVRSSSLTPLSGPATDRSGRLARLVSLTRCGTYLCGRGGRRYLTSAPFDRAGIRVRWFEPSTQDDRADLDLSALARLTSVEAPLSPRRSSGPDPSGHRSHSSA
ncbi:WbqC family protein [Pseudonocardia sp. HH130630-07]|uniref:WbqC family protein n=1 Tax=Pseudonocardia sp. HH130630-07 TaxID=1690815 RepID=UPI0018D2FEA0|nr:WbqC family protein [Pseudonocardia sp. HH130630-07]